MLVEMIEYVVDSQKACTNICYDTSISNNLKRKRDERSVSCDEKEIQYTA